MDQRRLVGSNPKQNEPRHSEQMTSQSQDIIMNNEASNPIDLTALDSPTAEGGESTVSLVRPKAPIASQASTSIWDRDLWEGPHVPKDSWSRMPPLEIDQLAELLKKKINHSPLSEETQSKSLGKGVSYHDWLLVIRANISAWSGAWGGVNRWVDTIDLFYRRARAGGQDEVDRFLLRMSRKLQDGKNILQDLES